MRATAGIGGEPRVVGEVGPVDDLGGDPLPLPVVGGAENHGLPVAGRECPVRRDRGRADAEWLLVDAGVLGVGQLIAHHVGQHIEKAQPDRRGGSFAAVAREEQREDGQRGVEASGEVGHRGARFGGHVGVSGDGA